MYRTLFLSFRNRSVWAAGNFTEIYYGYGNLNTALHNERVLEDGTSIMMKIIDRAVIDGILIKLKIYDINGERFLNDFYLEKYFLFKKMYYRFPEESVAALKN